MIALCPASTGEGETGLHTGASWQWGEYPLAHTVEHLSPYEHCFWLSYGCVPAISSKDLVSGATVGQGHLQDSSAL